MRLRTFEAPHVHITQCLRGEALRDMCNNNNNGTLRMMIMMIITIIIHKTFEVGNYRHEQYIT